MALNFFRLGNPTDSQFIESFDGSLRDECLNVHWFMSLQDARAKIESWRQDYNHFRPHSALSDTAPAVYASQLQGSTTRRISGYDLSSSRAGITFRGLNWTLSGNVYRTFSSIIAVDPSSV